MSVDALKIFIYGLPPDCEASTLKDFLEAVCDCPGAVTKVSIPYKKTFAFITLSCPEIAKCFLGNTLLFCNDAGELYQVKARPYVKQQFQRKKVQEYIPKVKPKTTSMPKIEPKPVKYTSPDFVQQFTPDYSMLSLSKPKRKKRKKDDLTVWFGGVGSTSFRRKARRKKQRKQASKLELLKSESFQFGVISESKCTISMVEDGTEAGEVVDKVVHGNGQELNEAEERAPPVEFVLIEHLNGAKSSCSISSHTQVIIDHDYLGPLCLQFTSPPTVADVKNELLMRTGLPVKDQLLYCNGKKLCDNLNLRCLLKDKQESLTLVLSVGTLKGGVLFPTKASHEDATGSNENPSASQEGLLPEKAPDEGAAGGEEDMLASQESRQSMETWGVEKTAAWLCKIGLDKKYVAVCHKEDINGRALLLLACKSLDKLVSIFQLKKGPKTILMKSLEPHLKSFDHAKPQTACNSEHTFSEWTEKALCNWLRELRVPKECLTLAEEEELNGEMFLLLWKLGKLQKVLNLKEGSWVVLDHELFLHLGMIDNVNSGTNGGMPAGKTSQLMSKLERNIVESKEVNEFEEPLATNTSAAKTLFEASPKDTLSKDKEKLLLLQSALQLDIEVSQDSDKARECVLRSIFVRRDESANALEKLFNFIVVTEDEMIGDTPQKLWSKIWEKMADWVTLLPEKDSLTLLWECGSETNTKVSLQDGKVGQIFLDRLCNEQYKPSLFVVLVDRQLLEENETVTYNFYLDEKRKHSYNLKLNVQESKYHASFDTNNPGLDLKLSKHFRSLMNVPRYQTPRPFASEFGNKYYNEGFVLDVLDNCETGSKDLMKPAREFKLLRRDVHNSEDDIIKKFFYETLRFACGCLNERTNGTIHFGVADEVEGQTCDYQPREIVGLCITDKPRYNDKLTEFINKCFVGDSRSNVHSCIQPPVFIPVKSVDAELPSDAKVVIEVDIEPRYSLCANEIFKAGFKCLDHGKEEPRAFIRHGSLTYAIDELSEIEDYVKNRLPKLDEERKNAEREEETVHSVPKHDSCKRLFDKLKRLLCANKKTLDSSIYPILVLSKPDTNMNQEFLNKTFHFIQNINWQVVIDFDDQGSESKGFFSVFKSGPKASQCDVHESEDYVDGTVGIGYKTHWIFANGYSKLNKKALGLKQWNRSKRKKGLSLVVQAIENTIPDMRAVVLFLLFSKDYEPIADIFLDCCMYLGGSNQLVYVAENSGIVKDWDAKLLNMCLEEHELRERGVVGMSWSEFQECLQQMVCGIDQRQLCVTMVTGSSYPLTLSFDNINVVSAKECEELRDLSHGECLQFSSKVEVDFYRGHPVTWANFWFTDAAHMNHVLRRNAYSKLKTLIEKLHSRSEGKVQTVTIHHHKGAGASTMARQALWDFRCNPHFPYRCAVVKTIDDETSKELLLLSKVGYSVNADVPFTPVLALVEDTDDFLFWELRSQVVEQANKLPRSRWPVCVFLYCKDAKKPYDCHLTEEETSVFLEQHLSKEEVAWFEDKYMKMKGNLYNKDPDLDFETYASENLTSFMIMKENFDPKYASSIVERNLNHVTDNELKLLKYTSLLQLYNPYPVFASWFDTIMLSLSLQRRKIFRDWIEDLTHSARIFLLEKDVSVHLGRGKVIAVVHPIIANALLDKIAGKKQTAVSQIAIDLLRSPLLGNKEKSFTSTYLYDGTSRMLKHQGKCEYDDNIQTKFSPLIEKILYVEDLKEQKRKPTEKSLQQATDVLREGLQKFKDPTITLQMVRVFNVNAAAFSKSTIDLCFDNALELCSMSIKMSPLNSFLCNAMGRIHESKIKILYGPVLEDNRVIEINDTTPVLSLAFEALKWFQKSQATADHQNNDGFLGELSVMFYLLGILRCVTIFRGREGLKKLQGYLAHCQAIPPEIKKPWNEFHEPIKDLRYRFSYCMEGLTEDFTIYKGNSPEERMLPNQIAFFKDQYHSYFGEGDLKWITESPEERWEFRWHKINQYLAGDIFSSVFSVHRSGFHKTPKEILQELKKLSYENYCEPVHKKHYNDLLLIVATTIALNSPYGKIPKHESTQLVEEYKELYSLVERLFTLEECDQGHKRLYAHLFKVMFLWPRKELELNSYRVQDFYDAQKKLKNRWERKCKRRIDTHNMLKQKIYNNMTFKEQTRQYTTLFYLGKGSGLDVFVHINELIRRKGSVEWENPQTKKRLKRLTGVVESENIIRMQNPLESRRTVDVYYSSSCQGVFSKEEVSFYLGFSWAQPIAFDVKYTNTDHVKLSVECSDAASDFEERGVVSRHQDVTFGITKGKIIKKAGRNPVLKGDISSGQLLTSYERE